MRRPAPSRASVSRPFRRPRRHLLAALAFIVGAALPTSAAPPVWLKLETDEFVIYSDAREKDVLESALRYAAYRRVFDEFFVPVGGSLPTTMLVLFRTEKSFREHTPPSTQKDTKLVNYSAEIDGTPLSVFSLAGDRQRALQMTFEFETIWGLKRLGYHVPIWMSQGTGGVLSTVVVQPGQVVVGQLGRPTGHALPWPKFFAVGQSSKVYQDFSQLGGYLDQARELMHWILLHEGSTRQRFGDLALRLRTTDGLDAVAEAMNTGAVDFHAAIRQHLRRTPKRTLVFDAPAVLAGFRISPAPEAEVLVITAELLVAAQRVHDAGIHLDRALALDPELPAVKAAWARRMFREGRPRDGIQLYREAIAAGSKNFAAYLRSAEARLDDAQTGGRDVAGEGGAAATTAVNELRQAIRLNPGSAEAYQALGRAFFVSPKVTGGEVEELSRGVFVGEQGQFVRFYRAALYNRLGQLDDALKDYRSLLEDPDVSSQNREIARRQIAATLFDRDAKRIDALLKAKDHPAARNLVQLAADSPDCEPARADYERLGRLIDENEAWLAIVALADQGRRAELHAAALAFAEKFPRSPAAAEARRLARTPLPPTASAPETAEPAAK